MRTKLNTRAALAGISIAAAVAVALPTAIASASATRPAAHATAAGLPKITVVMTGKKITVGGALQSGGVQIVSTVTGERAGRADLRPARPRRDRCPVLQAAGRPGGAGPELPRRVRLDRD